MMRLVLRIFFLIALAEATLDAQMPGTAVQQSKSYVFVNILTRLKSGDTSIDFRALRMAFAETDAASPFGSDREARARLTLAVSDKRYSDALKIADDIFRTNYIAPDVHAAASVAQRGLGDVQKAEFHKYVYLGLVNSILTDGDGKAPETAYRVISVEEEYAVMRALGLTVWGQSLGRQNGQMFEVLSATDEKRKSPIKVYFNIDIVWNLELKRRGQKLP